MNLSGFKLKRNKLTKPGLCGLQIMENGVAITYVIWKNNKPELVCCDFLSSQDSSDISLPALASFVKKNNLEDVRCSWILQAKDYILLPVGNLPVTRQEITQALHWYVKDKIDYPIVDASIDYFTIPYLNQPSKEEFIYAVVAKKAYLEKTSRLIAESGLDLQSIDIPELALRNMAVAQHLESEKSVGIIEASATRASLLFIQKNMIYLMRQIEWDQKTGIDKLPSEIQRSMDYYENELGQPSVQHFYISPAYQVFFPELKNYLPFEIQDFEWDQLKDKRCFVAAGGALRQEQEEESLHAPAN